MQVKFNIECEMEERWVNDFCSMLKWMERCGKIGHSSLTAFYADGDGDFRPKFCVDRDFDKTKGLRRTNGRELASPEIIFDAG